MDINYKLQTKLKQFAMIDSQVMISKHSPSNNPLKAYSKGTVNKNDLQQLNHKDKSVSKSTTKIMESLDMPSYPSNVSNPKQNFQDDYEEIFEDNKCDVMISKRMSTNNNRNSNYLINNKFGKSSYLSIASPENDYNRTSINYNNNYKLNEESNYNQIYNFSSNYRQSKLIEKASNTTKSQPKKSITNNERNCQSGLSTPYTQEAIQPKRQLENQSHSNTDTPEKYTDLKKIYRATKNGELTTKSTSSQYVVLYEDSKRLKNKKDKMAQDNQKLINKNSKPKITSMAHGIKREVNNFHERLYPYHKLSTDRSRSNKKGYAPDHQFENENQNLYKILDENDVYDIYGNRLNQDNIYRRDLKRQNSMDPFTSNFSPVINQKSIEIASKLEPAFVRLTAKRSKSKTSTNSLNQSKSSLNKSKDRSTSSMSYLSTPGRSLYEKGVQNMRKKDEVYKKRVNELSNDYLQFSYKPNLQGSLFNQSDLKDDLTQAPSQFERSMSWKNRVGIQVSKNKESQMKEQMKDCTFVPQISKAVVMTDERTIKRNLSQIYGYVKKRRDHLSKEKSSENDSKKIFVVSKNHEIKRTTPAPVDVYFEIDKRINRKSIQKQSNKEDVHVYRNMAGSQNFYETSSFTGQLGVNTGKSAQGNIKNQGSFRAY